MAAIRKLPYTFGKGFVVDAVKKKEVAEALWFTATMYCGEEPMALYLKTPAKSLYELLMTMHQEDYNSGLSIAIKDDKSNYVGCVFNAVFQLPPKDAKTTLGPVVDALGTDSDWCYQHYYSMNKLQGKVMTMMIAAVDPRRRGLKLAQHAVYGSCLLGKNLGFARVQAEATNRMSYNTLTNTGLKVVKVIPYDEWTYKGANGPEQPLKGINDFYTEHVNKARKGKEPFKNAATSWTVMDAAIDDAISKCETSLI